MSDTVWAAIVGGIAGVVTGSISAVIAPWANWGIEKRRLSHESRKTIIHNARQIVVNYRRLSETTWGENQLGFVLAQNSAWVRIKPFLDDDVYQELDAANTFAVRSREAQHALAVLEEDITRLEKSWKLI